MPGGEVTMPVLLKMPVGEIKMPVSEIKMPIGEIKALKCIFENL